LVTVNTTGAAVVFRAGLATPLTGGDEVSIVPAVAGGV
jgi:molybdopterin converting factor small subunit